ncbi:hypothetical protein FQA39_LY19424 [Lamprigera yunnana]|nr:hypothetical protein FQA39_LY19424 [Lamprigera yunnana]
MRAKANRTQPNPETNRLRNEILISAVIVDVLPIWLMKEIGKAFSQHTRDESDRTVNKHRPCLVERKTCTDESKRYAFREFVEHRHDVIVRRTFTKLGEAEKRAEYLRRILIALDHLDEVIKINPQLRYPEDARIGLMEKIQLSDLQDVLFLDMTLRRLTGLERDEIEQRGIAQLSAKMTTAAIAAYKKALAIDPNFFEANTKFSDHVMTKHVKTKCRDRHRKIDLRLQYNTEVDKI